MSQENKEEKKVQGPKYTEPQTFRTPKSSSYSSWSKSLEGQMNHLNKIKEEARKCAEIRGYTPTMKIGKRFKYFFDQEVLESRKRSKRRKQRKKND